MRYEPVLCDFDGTLGDSAPIITAALRDACSELQITIPDGADLNVCVGPPLEVSIPELFGEAAPVNDIIEAYRRHYIKTAPIATQLMPGAGKAIETWRSRGIRVGIVSYKPLPILQVILDGMGLSPNLSVVKAPDIGNPPESKTALLEEALSQLRPHGARPLFIGDHPADESAAREAGVDFIRYPDRSWLEIQKIVLDG